VVEANGNVQVKGDIILTNADCAEDFDIANAALVEPGTVMVLGEEGVLKPSDRAYDKRVAGVVSGAGGYRPGIVLDKQPAQGNRSPIALQAKSFARWTRIMRPSRWVTCRRRRTRLATP